jgi:hypothetical protein
MSQVLLMLDAWRVFQARTALIYGERATLLARLSALQAAPDIARASTTAAPGSASLVFDGGSRGGGGGLEDGPWLVDELVQALEDNSRAELAAFIHNTLVRKQHSWGAGAGGGLCLAGAR